MVANYSKMQFAGVRMHLKSYFLNTAVCLTVGVAQWLAQEHS